jgi:hypothetical protein
MKSSSERIEKGLGSTGKFKNLEFLFRALPPSQDPTYLPLADPVITELRNFFRKH